MGPKAPYRHTSIKTNACQAPSAAMAREFSQRDLTAKQCPGADDWKVFVVYSGDLSWLEIASGGLLWSTQEQVVRQSQFGREPHISSDGVQWLPGTGTANTLIFHVEAQEDPTPSGPGKKVSRLGSIRLDGEAPNFCGFAKTETDAKAMSEIRQSCTGELTRFAFKP
jgi:hypothetical protein